MKRIGLRLFWGQDKFQTPFSTNTELVIQTLVDKHRLVIRCDQITGHRNSAVSGFETEGMHANTIPFPSQAANGLTRKWTNF